MEFREYGAERVLVPYFADPADFCGSRFFAVYGIFFRIIGIIGGPGGFGFVFAVFVAEDFAVSGRQVVHGDEEAGFFLVVHFSIHGKTSVEADFSVLGIKGVKVHGVSGAVCVCDGKFGDIIIVEEDDIDPDVFRIFRHVLFGFRIPDGGQRIHVGGEEGVIGGNGIVGIQVQDLGDGRFFRGGGLFQVRGFFCPVFARKE